MRHLPYLVLVLSFALGACSPSYKPFTSDLQRSQGWTEGDLKRIQFYTSRDIILHRELSRGETVIDGGKIVMKEGRRVEEVVIREGTPGVLQFMPKPDRMAISFDRGNDRYLMFGTNPRSDGEYMLLGSSWDKYSGTVTYRGKTYNTSSQSAFAGLLVDLEHIDEVSLARHTAPGRTVK